MPKVADVLKHKDGGPSVEDARKAMLAAGEAPKGLSPGVTATEAAAPPADAVAVVEAADRAADVLEPEFAAEEVAAPVVAPAVIVAPEPLKIERIETEQFTGEIRQEKGKWVAELTYKSGAGAERFIADSKNDLMLALLKGKGHATLRVKEAVRREKLGGPKLDREYPLPADITAEDFAAMPEKQQDAMLYTIASQQTLLFRDAHPEFFPTPKNAEMINQYVIEHSMPITLRNLEHAFEDLADNGLLETRPVAAVAPSLSVAPVAPVSENTEPAPVAPVAAPAAAVVPAAAAPVVIRKRGTTGLQPGHASSPSDLGGPDQTREPSEAELRKLPLTELKRIADADRRARSGSQR